MLKLLSLLIGTASAQVTSHSYLIFPNQAACLTRSQQMCQAMKCDGVGTIWWWDCSTQLAPGLIGTTVVTSGSFGMRIDLGTLYSLTTSNQASNGIQGLTTSEQALVVPFASISTLIISSPTTSGVTP